MPGDSVKERVVNAPKVVALYNPKTTRERHPLISDFNSGFRELIVRLAGKLSFSEE